MNAPAKSTGLAETAVVTVAVIGAGQAGLAMSRCLTRLAIDHVVLERGQVGYAWRHQRWDSLRLLTPNRLSHLPGYRPGGPAEDFMSAAAVARYLAAYAGVIAAPVVPGVAITAVRRHGDGYSVESVRGRWHCRAVVLATGACALPTVPALAERLPAGMVQLTPYAYRHSGQLPAGGVLVVGGSATGAQLADEIHRSGRPVTLAVGEHVRLPRRYRGVDILGWMASLGLLDERYDEVEDLERLRRLPSPQLVGSMPPATLDLNALQAAGVRVVGRLVGLDGSRAQFTGGLANLCALADLKLTRLLERIDGWASRHGLDAWLPPPERFAATDVAPRPLLELNLERHGIRTVLWATGFRPDYSWLAVPALDRKGRLRHEGGVVAVPGLYAMGLPFMRRRKSAFLCGVGDDAEDLGRHLAAFLGASSRRRSIATTARMTRPAC